MDIAGFFLVSGEVDVPIDAVAAGKKGMVRTAPQDGYRPDQAHGKSRLAEGIEDAIGLEFKRPAIHHFQPVIPSERFVRHR